MTKRLRLRGLSLTELVAVLALMVVLATVAASTLSMQRSDAADLSAVAALTSAREQLQRIAAGTDDRHFPGDVEELVAAMDGAAVDGATGSYTFTSDPSQHGQQISVATRPVGSGEPVTVAVAAVQTDYDVCWAVVVRTTFSDGTTPEFAFATDRDDVSKVGSCSAAQFVSDSGTLARIDGTLDRPASLGGD